MNFSASQWLISFALDAFIKGLISIYVGVLVTLGAASVTGFILFFFGIFVSALYFAFLFLANRLVATFERVEIHLPRWVKFVLVLTLANVFFAACVIYTLVVSARDFQGALVEGLWVSGFLVVTNLASILIVATLGYIANRLARRH